MRRATLVAGAVLVVLMTSSVQMARGADTEAQARSIMTRVVNWVPNVALDFVDIFEGTVGIGPGNGIDVRFTRLLEAGFSDYNITRYGLNGRNDSIYEEAIDDGGIGLLGFTFGDLDRSPYELGFTFHIVNFGLDASVNARSALDFLGGIIFIDVEGDDKVYF